MECRRLTEKVKSVDALVALEEVRGKRRDADVGRRDIDLGDEEAGLDIPAVLRAVMESSGARDRSIRDPWDDTVWRRGPEYGLAVARVA